LTDEIVRFDAVRKRFDATEALRGVSFAIRAGEFVGLAGVNGAGKTTLIKCMLDFCAPDAGRITLFGLPNTQARSRERLAFLPERFVPPYYLTGADFLAYSAALQQRDYTPERIAAMMRALDLDARALARPVRTYSKGMTQKLGLAAIFLAERDLLVLDEPMSGLDPKARACVKTVLSEARTTGRTLFFTSHSLADIEEICDRVVVLHRGVPYFAGTPRQLCQDFGGRSIEQAFLRCIEARDP
jgi:ABC-type multidrug transport system ATPase subunit